MGKKDSSLTRAVPAFDELRARDPEGTSWLGRLLSVPARPGIAPVAISVTGTLESARWGEEEQSLSPPIALLRWLVVNPGSLSPPSKLGTKSVTTRAKREALLACDRKTREAALALLDSVPQKRKGWHIFEGPTYPDVFLQTDDVIIVIEGKRTEEGATTSTQWMSNRHQMLRHLDCAWEIRGPRKVYGFFIVEGEEDEISSIWTDACSATISELNLRESLPHRNGDERDEIAKAFLGVASWQQLCRTFEISFSSLPDEV